MRGALNAVLFGQETLVDNVITALLARGHLLLEGLPGLGKTELVKGLAKALRLDAKRVQFTPDLLPGDITGNPILQEENGRRQFVFQPGPLFANLVLADEINRASPKTQSALLEAMQERRVTVMGQSHPLPDPFFVLATQNPIELEGTYPLPEAQLDRFLFKLEVTRNGVAVLERIVQHRQIGVEPVVEPVLTREELLRPVRARGADLPAGGRGQLHRAAGGCHPRRAVEDGGRHQVRREPPRGARPGGGGPGARAAGGRLNASFEDVRPSPCRVAASHRARLPRPHRRPHRAGTVRALLEEVPAQVQPVPSTLRAAKL